MWIAEDSVSWIPRFRSIVKPNNKMTTRIAQELSGENSHLPLVWLLPHVQCAR